MPWNRYSDASTSSVGVDVVEPPDEPLSAFFEPESTAIGTDKNPLVYGTAEEGVAIIPVHGKGNLAKSRRLFTVYEIRCFVVFDNDGDEDDKEARIRADRR